MTGNTSIKLTKFSRFLLTVFIIGGGYFGVKFLYPYFKDKIPSPPPTEQPTVNDTYDVMPENKTVVPVTETKAPQYKRPLAEQKEILLNTAKQPETPSVSKKSALPKKQPKVVQEAKAKKPSTTAPSKGALDLEDDHKREKVSTPKGALDLEDDHKKKKK